jgi:hypothetical protein
MAAIGRTTGEFVMNKLMVLGFNLLGCVAMGLPAVAQADVEFDQYVTPDVIFGTGNSNGGFTTDRRKEIELGLRAKIPFAGILNSNGDGTYSYSLAETDHDGNAATANRWNFEFTVNTDFAGGSGHTIDDFTYELGMDGDPGLGTDFLTFDPITPGALASFFDHSIGDNSTPNGGGTEAGDAVTYANLIAGNNVLQQSWRYAFFPFPPLDAYDPAVPGTYTVYLLAKNSDGIVIARSDIQVLIGGAEAAGPKLVCEGFEPPLHADVFVNKPSRVLPLRMALFDEFGNPLGGNDLLANPVLQVTYAGGYEGDADLDSLETAGKGDEGNMFVFDGSNWAFNMKTRGLASGQYVISVASGDVAEYVIDPACQVNVTVK